MNGAAPGNIASQLESPTLVYTHAEGINRRDVNAVRCSPQRAEPRSSDPIQRHRAATRKFRPVPLRILRRSWGRRIRARIRWARCGLVLIGSTSWIVDDVDCWILARVGFLLPSFLHTSRLKVIFGAPLVMDSIPRFPAVKFSRRNSIPDVPAN